MFHMNINKNLSMRYIISIILLILQYLLKLLLMPKVWLAIFFGYNGSTFNGMQFQIEQHVKSIQALLAEKFMQGGFLSTNHFGHLQKNQRWSRAARTDKGVHALINGISCLFNIGNEYYEQDGTLNRNRVHLELKELFEDTQIVYHCFKRVTNRFEIRHMVKSRHYSYFCPKILFINNSQSISNQEKIQINNLSLENDNIIIKKLNQCCQLFKGTHNFHNYSKNLKAKDPQAQRYVLDFKVQSINQKYLCFDIIGQSFIYHQIRKIIGCIIMVMANNYPPNFITNTFFKNQIHMPLAPPHGLFLSNLNFGAYNRKNDIPEVLQFDGIQSVQVIKNNVHNFIMNLDDKIWLEWLSQLKNSIYHGIEYKPDDNQEVGPNDE